MVLPLPCLRRLAAELLIAAWARDNPETVTPSRYREARTLVRRLCRLPGEDCAQFKNKIARLREHFERFNVDVSELSQWLMGLRQHHADPQNPGSFGVLGDFLLEPGISGIEADESERDRWRSAVFDVVAGFAAEATMGNQPLPESLRHVMQKAIPQRSTPTTQKLIERLRGFEPAHRLARIFHQQRIWVGGGSSAVRDDRQG